MPLKYKSLFISDTHLGSTYNKSEKLFNFLEKIEVEQLFLVGDIINRSASKSHPDVIKFIELIQSREWKIIYIAGNNEDDREDSSADLLSCREELSPKESYIYKNGQTSIYLEHGHRFHDKGLINKLLRQGVVCLKWILVQLRKKRISYSSNGGSTKVQKERFYHRYIKPTAQKLLLRSFKSYMSARTKEKGCSMVVCGHFHTPEESMIKGIRYFNCGDWVKNSSYVVEREDGEFLLIEEK
jgi:UDP-2,3-diacylglucosamine pyrophosphatase LpxH